MFTDKQRIAWLCARVSYLEHSDKDGVPCVKQPKGGYWPQAAEQNDNGTVIDELADMPLIDYIDAMIEKEEA